MSIHVQDHRSYDTHYMYMYNMATAAVTILISFCGYAGTYTKLEARYIHAYRPFDAHDIVLTSFTIKSNIFGM